MKSTKRIHALKPGDRVWFGDVLYTVKRSPVRARARGFFVVEFEETSRSHFPTGSWSAYGDNHVTVEVEAADPVKVTA